MKRTRAQQPIKGPEPQDPAAAADPKPQRRAKQPRQPKAAKKPGTAAATTRGEGGAATAAAATVAGNAAVSSVASPAPETAPTVPDVCGSAAGEAGSPAVDWDLVDAGLGGGGAWWTWGVDEEKLLGWFPFVEEDFRCLAGRAGADAEVAFDDDIWRIHQIYEIPNYAAK